MLKHVSFTDSIHDGRCITNGSDGRTNEYAARVYRSILIAAIARRGCRYKNASLCSIHGRPCECHLIQVCPHKDATSGGTWTLASRRGRACVPLTINFFQDLSRIISNANAFFFSIYLSRERIELAHLTVRFALTFSWPTCPINRAQNTIKNKSIYFSLHIVHVFIDKYFSNNIRQFLVRWNSCKFDQFYKFWVRFNTFRDC